MADWLNRCRAPLFFAATLLALAGVALFEARRPDPVPLDLTPSPSATVALPSPTASELRVYVSGAVRRPDVYRLPPGSIAKDAVRAAGGPTDEGDLDRINLAQPLADGDHIRVPKIGEAAVPIDTGRAGGTRIDINTADAAALESLPGIGPSLARQIVDYRQQHGPFARPDDLLDVPGIGPATLDQVRDLITTN